MTKSLLTVHVLAAILAIGPVAVAASMFPAAVRRARAESAGERELAVVVVLHRICRVYTLIGIAVPVFGFATAGVMHVTGNAWVILSIGLTAVAAVVLALLVLPRQAQILTELGKAAAESTLDTLDTLRRPAARLAMYTGVFNLLWVAVTVLMIVRPGSTTGG